jgi:hypothetical protein
VSATSPYLGSTGTVTSAADRISGGSSVRTREAPTEPQLRRRPLSPIPF